MFKYLRLIAVSTSLLLLSANSSIASHNHDNNVAEGDGAARVAAVQEAYNPKNWGHLFDRHLLNREQLDPKNPLANQNPLVVWSFDGGGVLGILGAHTYAVADQVVKLLKVQNPALKGSIYDYIDVFAGTSTGGIFTIAANLPGPDGRPKLSPIELYRLYRFYGPEIFKKHVGYHFNPMGLAGTKYNHCYIEELLQDYCRDAHGEQILYKDLLKPVFVTAYSMSSDVGILLSSTDNDQVRDLCAWQVGRSTSAAPSYFDPIELTVRGIKHTLVDGGVWENDPGLKVIEEIVRYYGAYAQSKDPAQTEQVIMKMISSGAGFTGLGVNTSDLTNSSVLTLLNKLLVSLFNAREKGVLESLQHYRDLSKVGLSHNHFGVALLDYQRFQPVLEADVKALDNIDPTALEVLTGVSKNNCMGDGFQTMLAGLLGVEVSQVKNVMTQAIKGVEDAAARADLSKNDYYSHLPWIYEYLAANSHEGSVWKPWTWTQTMDFKAYFADKVRLMELDQNPTIVSCLEKAVWLVSFVKHNMRHDLLKTHYSGAKDWVRTGAHMQAVDAVCDLIGGVFKRLPAPDVEQNVTFTACCNTFIEVMASIYGDATVGNGHMKVYQKLAELIIQLASTLPQDTKTILLAKVKTQLEKTKHERSVLSSIKSVVVDSWHAAQIAKIDAALLPK
jgi:patatin-like phospholipase/acyl hydrolase